MPGEGEKRWGSVRSKHLILLTWIEVTQGLLTGGSVLGLKMLQEAVWSWAEATDTRTPIKCSEEVAVTAPSLGVVVLKTEILRCCLYLSPFPRVRLARLKAESLERNELTHWPKERVRLDTKKSLIPVLLGTCRGPSKMGSFLWERPEKTEDAAHFSQRCSLCDEKAAIGSCCLNILPCDSPAQDIQTNPSLGFPPPVFLVCFSF